MNPNPKLTQKQGMEIVFRKVYGIDFDSQEQHDHDQATTMDGGQAEEEGRGLLPPPTSMNGAKTYVVSFRVIKSCPDRP